MEIIKFANTGLDVKIDLDTSGRKEVWLSPESMAKLFGKDRSVINKHIAKAYKDWEVESDTFRETLIERTKGWVKWKFKSKEYSLDVILSVGFKANGSKAVAFRKWASTVLWSYIKDWYVINRKLLAEKKLEEVVSVMDDIQRSLILAKKADIDEIGEILSIIRDYGYSFKSLHDYDEESGFTSSGSQKDLKYILDYDSAIRYIKTFREELIKKGEAKGLFWQEKTHQSLAWILGNIFNGFFGQEAYPSLEEKASHLLYFIIKDHPFNDWNKRIASMLFTLFLDKNNFLRTKKGELKISDWALAGIVITIAESNPKMKEFYVNLIINALKKS